MTIFEFQVSSNSLDKLPSVKLTTEICMHIFEGILQHFCDTLMQHSHTGQQQLKTHLTSVQWHLGILSRVVPSQSNNNYSFTVHRIFISKKVTNGHLLKRVFSMNDFKHIDCKLLLECAAQLLENNLECIKLHLPDSLKRSYDNCYERLNVVISELTFLVGNNPEHRNLHGSNRVMLTNLDSIRLLVEIDDQNNEITFLDQ